MTKEELAVKIFQRSKSRFVKESARKAIENNTEAKFIDDVLISINEHKAISDWYTHMLGEDLYNELQKFKTEK